MAKPGETWETDKPYDEVVDLVPHLRAIGVSRVWVRDLPLEDVDALSPSSLRYDDLTAGVVLSIHLPDVELCSSFDLVRHRGSVFRDIDVDRVATLVQGLPEVPRAKLVEVIDGWYAAFHETTQAQTRRLDDLRTVRDQLAAFASPEAVEKARADGPEGPRGA